MRLDTGTGPSYFACSEVRNGGRAMKTFSRSDWPGIVIVSGLFFFVSCAGKEEGDLDAGRGRVLVLTEAEPSASASDTLVAPGRGFQKYTLYAIDTRDFASGGMLKIVISVGAEGCNASFDLFPEGASIPEEGRPTTSVAHVYDVGAGGGASLEHRFGSGQVFRFGATGNWFSPAGERNTYAFTASVLDSE
jgi:hypothetical protein